MILALSMSILTGAFLYSSDTFKMQSYLISEAGRPVIRISTSVKLAAPKGDVLKALPALDSTVTGNHYVFCPGRGDHAEKYISFMHQIAAQGHAVWCIDPYAQGGSEGGVICEFSSAHHPCCARKGHGIWEEYIKSYISGIAAISKVTQGKRLIGVAHSMAATIDMCARLDPRYSAFLKEVLAEIHYVAPMVHFTLFLKDKIGTFGEEVARYVLSWAAWGLTFWRKGDQYFFMTKGPINVATLTPADVLDKIHPSKAADFIKICQQNTAYEVGSITNRWFLEALRACSQVRQITPAYLKGISLYVHVPEADAIVYPHHMKNFFGKYLPNAHTLFVYKDEPHNLFWGSDEGITALINNLTHPSQKG